jgi:hypothetical protein
MKIESSVPATPDEVARVLAQLPDLTASGFDSYYAARHERKNARRVRDGLEPEVWNQSTSLTDPEVRRQIASARIFLRKTCCRTRTIRRIDSSYGLKHVAERWSGTYISNGAFIAAAYLEGYAIEREGPNALFSLSFTREYRRVRRQRLTGETSDVKPLPRRASSSPSHSALWGT